MSLEPEREVDKAGSSLQTTSSSQRPLHAMEHAESAHHLKFGAIKTAGFMPGDHLDDAESVGCNADHLRERDLHMERLNAVAQQIHRKRRYLFRKPRPLQYFRGHTLIRDESERGSQRLELFFDLVFVGIIAVLAGEVIMEQTGHSLVRYLITYGMAWVIWGIYRELNDSFWHGDAYQCILTLVVMIFLVVFGNNAIRIDDMRTENGARATAIGAYLLAEFSLYSTQFWYSFFLKPLRLQMRVHHATWVLTTALWIGAIFADWNTAIGLAVLALFLEYFSWAFCYSPAFKRMFNLRYSSALSIDHEVERAADFFTLVIGETIFSVVYDYPANHDGFYLTAATGRAALATCIAFVFLMLYTMGSSCKSMVHPLRRNMWTATAWFTLHMPLVSSLTLFGDACGDFVKDAQVETPIRWILCGTYSVAMISLWANAFLEADTDVKGHIWVPKFWRLLPRMLAGIIVVFLPLSYYSIGEHHEEAGGEAASATAEGAHGAASAVVSAAAETGSHAIQLLARLFVDEVHVPLPPGEPVKADYDAEQITASLNSTAILGIMAALSLGVLFWEWIASLDGPETPAEQAPEHLRDGDQFTPAHALKTPEWTGFPTLFEPGFMHWDKSHQRDVDADAQDAAQSS